MRISSRKNNKILYNNSHQNYVNSKGELVPSVTTILKTLSKGDALVIWANNLGWKHKSYKKELEDAAIIGTVAHAFCEYVLSNDKTILEEIDKELENMSDEMSEKTHNAISSFMQWWSDNKEYVEPISTELQLSCEDYGGTADLICKYKGKRMILDYKTSSSFYMTQYLQLAAYAKMYKKKYNKKISDVAVLRLDKKHGKKAKMLKLSKLPNGDLKFYQRIFDKLAELYKFIYVLNNDWDDYSKKISSYVE